MKQATLIKKFKNLKYYIDSLNSDSAMTEQEVSKVIYQFATGKAPLVDSQGRVVYNPDKVAAPLVVPAKNGEVTLNLGIRPQTKKSITTQDNGSFVMRSPKKKHSEGIESEMFYEVERVDGKVTHKVTQVLTYINGKPLSSTTYFTTLQENQTVKPEDLQFLYSVGNEVIQPLQAVAPGLTRIDTPQRFEVIDTIPAHTNGVRQVTPIETHDEEGDVIMANRNNQNNGVYTPDFIILGPDGREVSQSTAVIPVSPVVTHVRDEEEDLVVTETGLVPVNNGVGRVRNPIEGRVEEEDDIIDPIAVDEDEETEDLSDPYFPGYVDITAPKPILKKKATKSTKVKSAKPSKLGKWIRSPKFWIIAVLILVAATAATIGVVHLINEIAEAGGIAEFIAGGNSGIGNQLPGDVTINPDGTVTVPGVGPETLPGIEGQLPPESVIPNPPVTTTPSGTPNILDPTLNPFGGIPGAESVPVPEIVPEPQ